MKTIALIIMVLFSYQLQAACKCNCNRADRSMCASGYDLDHPCGSICSSPGGSVTSTMITACPLVKATNPVTGRDYLITDCMRDNYWTP